MSEAGAGGALDQGECRAPPALVAMRNAMLEGAPDQLYLLDSDGLILHVNHVIDGFSIADVVGRNWLSFLPPDEHERVRQLLLEVVTSGEMRSLELMAIGPNTSVAWYASQLGRTRGDANQVVVVARDITAAKLAEAEMLMADRSAQLAQVIASLSHEINNPLASILASLEVLRASATTQAVSGEGLRATFDDMQRAAARISATLSDFRIFSQDHRSADQAVAVGELVESTLRVAANRIRHRARVRSEIEPGLHAVAAPQQLGQVLLSLLLNAAEASPLGSAEQHDIVVRARADAASSMVVLEVEDDGCGIAPANHASIFVPFFSTKRSEPGVGLGLTVSQRIVASLGGRLEFDSVQGKGSRFRVHVPLAKAEAIATLPESKTSARARVLFVDDERVLAAAMGRILGRDHDLVVENEAEKALERVKSGEQFDIVLCDVMMPSMSGPEFHRELSLIAPDLAQKTVFMTGGAFAPEARSYLRSVDNRQLEKPIPLATLLELLARSVSDS